MNIRPAFNLIPSRTNVAERPSWGRLRRVSDRWLQVDHSTLMARIEVLQHGGHKRPVVTRGSKHLRFRFTSTKTRTTQLGEGKGERFLAHYNDVASHVVDFQCHPFMITFRSRGALRRYRPDAIRQLDDGVIELIEAKRSHEDLHDEDYRELLAEAAELSRQCGWRFRDMHLIDIFGPAETRRPSPRQHNVERLFGSRTMELTPLEERVAAREIARGKPLLWSDLSAALAPKDSLQGDAIIEHLLARSRLSADLDIKLNGRTVLNPCVAFTGVSGIRL